MEIRFKQALTLPDEEKLISLKVLKDEIDFWVFDNYVLKYRYYPNEKTLIFFFKNKLIPYFSLYENFSVIPFETRKTIVENYYPQSIKDDDLIYLCRNSDKLFYALTEIKFLIQNGANVNCLNIITELIMWKKYEYFSPCMNLLLELGADIFEKDENGKNWFDAIKSIYSEKVAFAREDIDKFLLKQKLSLINILIDGNFLIKDLAGIVGEYLS